MGLTTRPSKNIDLSKIDDIQNEFFGEKIPDDSKKAKADKTGDSTKKTREKAPPVKSKISSELKVAVKNTQKAQKAGNAPKEAPKNLEIDFSEIKKKDSGSMKIADLLATAKVGGVRYTSRPFTVPRSLTIDLNRLKSKFRTRDLQYTQNELMDKMIKESLEIVTAENYFSLREKAFKLVKSPEQSSRRSVTLTEETVSGMAEIKADLAHAHGRRFSSDEIFTTLLAIAFALLYENGLL